MFQISLHTDHTYTLAATDSAPPHPEKLIEQAHGSKPDGPFASTSPPGHEAHGPRRGVAAKGQGPQLELVRAPSCTPDKRKEFEQEIERSRPRPSDRENVNRGSPLSRRHVQPVAPISFFLDHTVLLPAGPGVRRRIKVTAT